MASSGERIRRLLDDLHADFDRELAERREALRYRIDRGRVRFEAEVLARHRAARISLGAFLRQTRPMVVLTAPFIYMLILPFAFLDLCVALYQVVCFPVYGITRVRRRDYIAIDRQHLAYLNALQKLNCVYCGYCNGVIALVREVAARTEKYWCPIKHARAVKDLHPHHADFFDYGDAEAYSSGADRLRDTLKPPG